MQCFSSASKFCILTESRILCFSPGYQIKMQYLYSCFVFFLSPDISPSDIKYTSLESISCLPIWSFTPLYMWKGPE